MKKPLKPKGVPSIVHPKYHKIRQNLETTDKVYIDAFNWPHERIKPFVFRMVTGMEIRIRYDYGYKGFWVIKKVSEKTSPVYRTNLKIS